MECHEALPFVSTLHDGEIVPRTAAEHIGTCGACSQCLKDYAEIGAELRLMASLASEPDSKPLWASPPARSWHALWKRFLTRPVRLPRFALGLGALVILTLSTGLGVIWAGRGESFQFQVASTGGSDTLSGGLDVGSEGTVQLGGRASHGFWAAKFKLLSVENGVARLDVRNRSFETDPKAAEARQALDAAADHVYEYYPGQTLTIPLEDGDLLTLTGKLTEKQPEINAPTLATNQIQINRPVLFRDGKLVAETEEGSSAGGNDPAVALLIPNEGRYFLMLKAREGAVPGEAYFGQARFQLEGKNYLLASAWAITGGEQPRQIWIYHDQATPADLSHPAVAAGNAARLIEKPE